MILTNFDINGSVAGYGCSSTTSGPGTWPVGWLPGTQGDSPYGLRDMAGNIYEWVKDEYRSDFYTECSGGCSDPYNAGTTGDRILRGSSYYIGPFHLRVVDRYGYAPTNRTTSVGFRCRRFL